MISIDHNFLCRWHILHTNRAYLVGIISLIGYHWLFPSLLVVKLVFQYPCSGSEIIVDPGRELSMQAYLGLCTQCKLPVWGSKS